MISGVTGEPTVATVVAGAGLAGGLDRTEPVFQQRTRRAAGDRALQREGDQARSDRIAFLRRLSLEVVAADRLALGVEHAADRAQGWMRPPDARNWYICVIEKTERSIEPGSARGWAWRADRRAP